MGHADSVYQFNQTGIGYVPRAKHAVNDSEDDARQSPQSGGFTSPLTYMDTILAHTNADFQTTSIDRLRYFRATPLALAGRSAPQQVDSLVGAHCVRPAFLGAQTLAGLRVSAYFR